MKGVSELRMSEVDDLIDDLVDEYKDIADDILIDDSAKFP
jgi:hypothetical protein